MKLAISTRAAQAAFPGLAALLLLSACGGGGGAAAPAPDPGGDIPGGGGDGGDGGGVVDPPGPVVLAGIAGTWNLVREGVSCEGEEFAGFPMRIDDLGSESYELRLGFPGSEFVFQAARSTEGVLSFTGTATVEGVTLNVVSASWTATEDGNELSGRMQVVRTENGVDCNVDDAIHAYRDDGSSAHIGNGAWEWSAETTGSNGACSTVGEVDAFEVEIAPQRENRFSIGIMSSPGKVESYVGTLDGTRLVVSGTASTGEGESSTLGAGSQLDFDASFGVVSGTLEVEALGSEGTCNFTLAIEGTRPVSGYLMPFLRDTRGAQTLVGIDASDPSAPVDLVASLNQAQFAAITTDAAIVDRLVVVAEKGVADAGTVTGHRPESLFYASNGNVHLVDLGIRYAGDGSIVAPFTKEVYTGDGAPIVEIVARTDYSDLRAVLFVRTADELTVVEVERNGTSRAASVLGSTVEPVGITYGEDGHYREALVRYATDLYRIQGNSVELFGASTFQAMAENGRVYYTSAEGLFVYDGSTPGIPTMLANATGVEHTLLATAGSELYYLSQDMGASTGRVYRSDQAGSVLELTMLFGLAIAPPVAPTGIVTADYLVMQYRNTNSDTAHISIDRVDGTWETLGGLPLGFDLLSINTHALGNLILSRGFNTAFAVSADPDAASSTIASAYWLTPALAQTHERASGRHATSATLSRLDVFELRVLDLEALPADPLAASALAFEGGNQLIKAVPPATPSWWPSRPRWSR